MSVQRIDWRDAQPMRLEVDAGSRLRMPRRQRAFADGAFVKLAGELGHAVLADHAPRPELQSEADAVATQSDGTIIAAGECGLSFCLARYGADVKGVGLGRAPNPD